jgi:hypothetical protein
MKNFCIIHILLFLLLMLAYQCAGAQDFVLTTKGDTVKGTVKPLVYGPERKVQVTTADKKKTIFPILQTRAYSFDGDLYHPIRTDKGYVFMKLIKAGYLSLYHFQIENQVAFDGQYLLKKDGQGLDVPNLTFKKGMVKFLSDCPEVAEKIDRGELTKKGLHQIVDEYNACVNQRTADRDKTIVKRQEADKKMGAWDVLEDKVKAKETFEGKDDALEMIADIRSKIQRGEKIPKFLLDGLKNSLASADLSVELENALKEVGN